MCWLPDIIPMFGVIFELLCLIGKIVVYYAREITYAILRNRPQKKINGESVLITGSAQGMGAVYARKFAELGNVCHCVDVSTEMNEKMVEGLKAQGYEAYSYTCDISNWEAIQVLKSQVEENGKPITYLINNAGICMGINFDELTPGQIKKTLEVNLLSQFFCTKTFLPDMVAKNYGHVVNMASTAGYIPSTRVTDYSASKYGSVGFSECLIQELAATDVKVTFICPFFTASGMFEGFNVRFPLIMPSSTPEEVITKAMRAIHEDQVIMMCPNIFYLLVAFKGLTPRPIFDDICVFLGSKNTLTNFTGRREAEKVK